MNRSALQPLLTVLMFAAACPALAAAQTVVMEVHNDAEIPASDLAEMEQSVARIYLAIGVRLIWEHGDVQFNDPRGIRVDLRLLSRRQADRMIAAERIDDAVLGHTIRPARLVYIFLHRVVEASMTYSHKYTRILDLVVAHELGHALLPAGSHTDSGVMKGLANFRAKIARDFTPEEAEAIRRGLTRWAR